MIKLQVSQEATKLFEYDKTTGFSLARRSQQSLLQMQTYKLVIFLSRRIVHVFVVVVFTGVITVIACRSRLELPW